VNYDTADLARMARPADGPTAGIPLALIAAVARNGVIGADNRLPWRLPEDMRRFRALTIGHTVVMGRRTWESLPRPLADRQNVVISRQAGYRAPGAEVVESLDAALRCATLPPPVCCIGGGEIYRLAIGRATIVHLTEIARDFDGDVTFPRLDPAEWRETAREPRTAEGPDGYDYAFVTYERRAPR
jgi:dihydrofolate reductase